MANEDQNALEQGSNRSEKVERVTIISLPNNKNTDKMIIIVLVLIIIALVSMLTGVVVRNNDIAEATTDSTVIFNRLQSVYQNFKEQLLDSQNIYIGKKQLLTKNLAKIDDMRLVIDENLAILNKATSDNGMKRKALKKAFDGIQTIREDLSKSYAEYYNALYDSTSITDVEDACASRLITLGKQIEDLKRLINSPRVVPETDITGASGVDENGQEVTDLGLVKSIRVTFDCKGQPCKDGKDKIYIAVFDPHGIAVPIVGALRFSGQFNSAEVPLKTSGIDACKIEINGKLTKSGNYTVTRFNNSGQTQQTFKIPISKNAKK